MLIGKNRLIRRRVIIGLLLAASLTLLTLSFRQGSQGVTGDIQRTALAITAPVSGVVHRVTQPVVDAYHWTAGLVDARQENERLKAQLDRAGANAVENEGLRAQVAKLQQELHYVHSKAAASYDEIGATVTAQSPNDYSRTVTLDVGTADGVAINDPVVAPYGDGAGLIGRVISATASSSIVMLIVDHNSAVYGSIMPGTAKGLLVPSDGDPNVLSMDFVGIDEAVDTSKELTVVTATYRTNKLQPLLPRGIPIGRVTNVSESDLSQQKTIQVTPFVDFQDLTDVLVLKPRTP
jgi:rod shape-determining protein MreC